MILLDTHIWVWLASESDRLTSLQKQVLEKNRLEGFGVSVISCWEIAKAVQNGRLKLTKPVAEWVEEALAIPGIQLVELTPGIAILSSDLPGTFHKDPADQIIVATAMTYDIELLTSDGKILSYPHVRTP